MNLDLWRRTKRERGLTYQDISDKSGLPIGTIKNIFAGYTPDPRESTINAIEQALGVETHIIYANEKSPSLSKDEQSVLDAYRALPEDLQRRARVYIEKLAELVAAEQDPARPFRA